MDNNHNPQPTGELAKYEGTPVSPYQGPTPPPSDDPSGYSTPTPPPAYHQPGYAAQPQLPPQSGYQAPPPAYQPPVGYQVNSAYQQPQYGAGMHTNRRDPNVAFLLELLGYLGFLGIGHMYAGNIIGGVLLLLFGWGAATFLFAVGAVFSIFTLGLGLCLLVPLYLGLPIISGLIARGIATRNNRRAY